MAFIYKVRQETGRCDGTHRGGGPPVSYRSNSLYSLPDASFSRAAERRCDHTTRTAERRLRRGQVGYRLYRDPSTGALAA